MVVKTYFPVFAHDLSSPFPYEGRNAVHSVLKLVMGFQFTVLIFDNVYLMNGTMVFFALIYVDSSVVILPSVFF